MNDDNGPQDEGARPDAADDRSGDGGRRSGQESARAHHSDHPGREYEGEPARPQKALHEGGKPRERHPHSGVHGPSEPRRPGTGERQAPRRTTTDRLDRIDPVVPGEIRLADSPVVINEGLPTTTLRVTNRSDRPIQVGSHFHFAEVNPALDFDRAQAWGKRLNVLSGGAVRFEPGDVEDVELVPFRGSRIALGFRGECKGSLDA